MQLAARGYDVIVNYSRTAAEAEATVQAALTFNVQALAYRADVASDEQVQAMFAEVRRTWGRLDILVNNAGTTFFIDHTDVDSMTEKKWDHI